MKPDVWNRLLDLLHLALMSPCRTKADADRIVGEIEHLRKDVDHERSDPEQMPGGGSDACRHEAPGRAGGAGDAGMAPPGAEAAERPQEK